MQQIAELGLDGYAIGGLAVGETAQEMYDTIDAVEPYKMCIRDRNKGATSGHLQKVVDLRADCDDDTLLVTVVQTGNACHTGAHSCFYKEIWEETKP